MSWDVEGWQTGDGTRFDGEPTDDQLMIADGVLVHAYDTDDPESDRYFWVFHPDFFYDWEEVDNLVDVALDGYGMTE